MPKENTSAIYNHIRFIAKWRGLSINQLEKDAGLSSGSICKWGSVSPSISSLQKVAELLEVTPNDLLGYCTTEEQEDCSDSKEILDAINALTESVNKVGVLKELLFRQTLRLSRNRITYLKHYGDLSEAYICTDAPFAAGYAVILDAGLEAEYRAWKKKQPKETNDKPSIWSTKPLRYLTGVVPQHPIDRR